MDRINGEEHPGFWADVENGILDFRYQYQGPVGVVIVSFYPEDKLTTWALAEGQGIIKRIFHAYLLQLEKEGRIHRVREPEPEIEGFALPEIEDFALTEEQAVAAENLAWWFVRAMQGKISMGLGELSREAVFVMEKLYQSMLSKSGVIDGKSVDISKIKEELEVLAKDLITERKTFLKEHLYLPTGKGRHPRWTKEKLEQATRKAAAQVRKEKYRPPRLSEVAEKINKRYPNMPPLNAKALGQLHKRYAIEWKIIKNPQK